MMFMFKRVMVSLALMLSLAAGVGGGVILDRQVLLGLAPPADVPPEAQPSFELMGQAWNTIESVYVDRTALDGQQLGYGAISGMVDALGDTGHSRFLTPEMVQQEHNLTQGAYEGIGTTVEMKDGHVVIVAPMDNSPAQRAGLQSGDILLQVNGDNVAGLSLSEVVSRTVGPAGTQVTLTILRPGTGRTLEVTLVRARVELQNVTWQILPGTQIAHVRVVAFSQGVSEDLRAALDQIPIASQRGLILDLRNDPGGLLDEAVATASLFLQGGDVLQVRDAQGQTQAVPVASDAPTYGLPMVVLVNQGTASAAEIVAGALQDPGRATLVGETTFGTGTVLQEFPLADGSRLLLATQEWLTPKGRVIWHQGLAPDIAVALSADSEPLFPGATRDLSIEQVQSGDPQLGRAIELLNADRQAKWIPLAPLAQLRGGAE